MAEIVEPGPEVVVNVADSYSKILIWIDQYPGFDFPVLIYINNKFMYTASQSIVNGKFVFEFRVQYQLRKNEEDIMGIKVDSVVFRVQKDIGESFTINPKFVQDSFIAVITTKYNIIGPVVTE